MWPESQRRSINRRLTLLAVCFLLVPAMSYARGARKLPASPATSWKVVETGAPALGDPLLPTPAERLNEQIRVARSVPPVPTKAVTPPDSSAAPHPSLAGGTGLPITSEPFLIGGFLLGLALIATSFWIGRRQVMAAKPAAQKVEQARVPTQRRGAGIVGAMLKRRNVPEVQRKPEPAPALEEGQTDQGVTPWWAELPPARRDLFTPARVVLEPAEPPQAADPAAERLSDLEAELAEARVAMGGVTQRLDLIEGSMLELIRSVEQLAVRIESRPLRTQQPTPAPRVARPAPETVERPELGPWEDPSLALPPQNPRIRPEPFFARVAAERAERRSQEQTAPAEPAPPPANPPAPAAPPEPPRNAPAEPPRPRVPAALPDLAKTRELVLSLARRGWDGEKISREAQLPRGDVSLILKTAPGGATPRIGAADSSRTGR